MWRDCEGLSGRNERSVEGVRVCGESVEAMRDCVEGMRDNGKITIVWRH